MKNKLKIIFVGLFIFITGISSVNAQIEIPLPSSTDMADSVVIDSYAPSLILNLRKFGILPMIGYFVGLLIFGLLLYAIIIGLKAAKEMIEARDSEDKVKDSLKKAQGISAASVFVFAALIVYILFSLFLGVGNVFKWPLALSQCGGDGEPLFRAEYRASTINPDLFKYEVLTYCCSNFEFRDYEEVEEDLGTFEWLQDYEVDEQEGEDGLLGFGAQGTGRWNKGDGVKVGSAEDGGWLFIADPGGGKPNVIPQQLGGASSCEYFDL